MFINSLKILHYSFKICIYLFIKEMKQNCNTIIIVFIKYYGCSSTPQYLRLFVFQISLSSCSSSVSMNNEML